MNFIWSLACSAICCGFQELHWQVKYLLKYMYILHLWNCLSWKQHFGLSYNPSLPTAPWIAYTYIEVMSHNLESSFMSYNPIIWPHPLNSPTVGGGGGHSGLNQGVRPSYYNFQISPRTLCTISTDCFAESPVTVSFDHILCTFCSINMRRFTHQMTNQ